MIIYTIMEVIEQVLIKMLKEDFSDKRIKEALTVIERKTIKNSTFFAKAVRETLEKANVKHVKNILELTTDELSQILKIDKITTKFYIYDIKQKINKAIIIQDKKRSNKKQAIKLENKINIIINYIKKNETILNLLREEILYEENYNNLNLSEQKTTKQFYYSRLNLNNYELSTLRKLLLKINEYNIEDSEFNEAIINIYKSINFFLKKIKYKAIIDNNYFDLEELSLTTKEIRTLNRLNIKYVSDLIELNDLTETKHILNKLNTSITNALYEKNIIIPKSIDKINEILLLENAGIKSKKIVK